MAGKRDKPEEIVLKLRQVEVLQGQGSSIAHAVRPPVPETILVNAKITGTEQGG